MTAIDATPYSKRGAAWIAAIFLAVVVVGVGAAQGIDRLALSDETVASSPQTLDFPGVADQLRTLGGDKFAGLEIQETDSLIITYWTGAVPEAARSYASSKPEGITIQTVTNAPFSRDALTSAASRVTGSDLVGQAQIAFVSAKFDGSGLEVSVEGQVPNRATRDAIAKEAQLPSNAIQYVPNTSLGDMVLDLG